MGPSGGLFREEQSVDFGAVLYSKGLIFFLTPLHLETNLN